MKKTYFYFIVAFLVGTVPLKAQEGVRYQQPPQSILELVDAPTTPSVSFSRSGEKALLYERPGFPTISDVSQPIVGLAGLRLNPANTSSAVTSASTGITLRDLKTGTDHPIQGLPAEPRIGNTSMNAAETHLAFTHSTSEGVELWIADLQTYQARRLVQPYVNAAYGPTLMWTPEGDRLLVSFIPDNRGHMPVEDAIPTGPVVQENLGKAAPSRTYQNLLQNEYDEALFDYFVTSQLAYVDLQGNMTKLGQAAIYRSVSFSPDGQYLLVQQVKRPYSYLVPASSFPYSVNIWNSATGASVKHLFDYPLNEAANLSRDGVTTNPRMYSWRPDQAATLYWVQALDEGDPKKEVDLRDAVYQLAAPFQGEPQHLISTEMRYAGISWTGDDLALLSERWSTTRMTRTTLFNVNSGEKLQVIAERSTDDRYTDPGRFLTTTNEYNRSVLLTDDRSRQLTLFTTSNGASPEGDRPFLMKWNVITGKQDTLFKSQAPYYESPVFFDNKGTLIISRESVTDAPNYFSVNLRNRRATPITNFPNPYPSLENVHKEQVFYQREDGLNLSGTLYLPAGYQKSDGPLPMLLWAYPREFESREAANQIQGSPYRFTRLSWGSPVFWVTRGYAILDNADMPIVGSEAMQPNDTFVEQLEANSKAAIDHLAGLGIVDPNRVGVGGHSYGAFMTANLLAHTDLFAAGLARSGAYNRTFTPFGFQNERRTYWEAQDLYNRMSPFSYAHQIKTPILLIHGMDDENSGTFPIQSERLYNAIKGHGGTARLVFLPKEFHGYRARESILHTLWEQDQWLETYVKNKK